VVSPENVVIGNGEQAATVTVTNTFLLGSLSVHKQREGLGADFYGAGPFEVTLTCTRDVDGETLDVQIPDGATRVLDAAGEYAAEYQNLPARAHCSLEETKTAGASASVIQDTDGIDASDVTIEAGESAQLTVVNTFETGAIMVTKNLTGGSADARGGGSFTVHLTCTAEIDGARQSIAVPGGADRTLSRSAGLVAHYDGVLSGADCLLTETINGGADRVSISPNTGDQKVGSTHVTAGGLAQLTVTNEFDAAALSSTGSDALPWLLAALAGLLGGGLLLFGRRRRA
jgi:LPXTG-motif cell wall-anchored protein